MKRYTLAICSVLSLVTTALDAAPVQLSEGDYAIRCDGCTGTLTLRDNWAALGIGGRSCAGGIEGPIARTADGTLSFSQTASGARCTIQLLQTPDALAQINTAGECGPFHGASCSFEGVVTGRQVALSINAIDAGFGRFDRATRKSLQEQLRTLGFLEGRPDGISGPSTRGAIIAAANAALNAGKNVSLESPDASFRFLSTLLTSALAPETPAVASQPPVSPAPAPAPQPPVSPTIAHPIYEGIWNRYEQEIDQPITVVIEPDVIRIDEFDLAARYTAATSLNSAGTAYRLSLRQGDAAYLFEASADHFYGAFEGTVMECKR